MIESEAGNGYKRRGITQCGLVLIAAGLGGLRVFCRLVGLGYFGDELIGGFEVCGFESGEAGEECGDAHEEECGGGGGAIFGGLRFGEFIRGGFDSDTEFEHHGGASASRDGLVAVKFEGLDVLDGFCDEWRAKPLHDGGDGVFESRGCFLKLGFTLQVGVYEGGIGLREFGELGFHDRHLLHL